MASNSSFRHSCPVPVSAVNIQVIFVTLCLYSLRILQSYNSEKSASILSNLIDDLRTDNSYDYNGHDGEDEEEDWESTIEWWVVDQPGIH